MEMPDATILSSRLPRVEHKAGSQRDRSTRLGRNSAGGVILEEKLAILQCFKSNSEHDRAK
jgi:hypothetical protein